MYYIAYGSNLNETQMSRRCPAAKKVGALAMPDWKLVFRGVADIEPQPGATLQCGVWKITKSCERALDIYEGVNGGLYRKEHLLIGITWANRRKPEAREALVYRMNSDGYALPNAYYFDAIREGYRNFGLPDVGLMAALGEAELHQRPVWNEWDWPLTSTARTIRAKRPAIKRKAAS